MQGAEHNGAATIPLGLYIWRRIRQCGIGSVFGVPGDFNLELLDHIYDVDGLDWIGSSNELNAAYATDGYARAKGGAGCFVTTHGVGEMSAINGLAGSMAEHVKVIQIIGQTSRKMQEDRVMIHHNVGTNPDHQVFSKATESFRCAAATLLSEDTACQEVDRVLRECFVLSKPVCLYVPTDMVSVQVPANKLDLPLNLNVDYDEAELAVATNAILDAIYNAKRPGMLVDTLVRQHDAIPELHDLLDELHIPVFTSVMGKSIVDESHPCFVGTYNGTISAEGVAMAFDACDMIVVLGDLPSDGNTGAFTRKVSNECTVYLNHDEAVVLGRAWFTKMPIKPLLKSLAAEIDPARVLGIDVPVLRAAKGASEMVEHITQAWIWPRLASFFEAGDVVLGETGTTSFGLPHATFPPHVRWITQAYWGSIGYATPAAFGAQVASNEQTAADCRIRARTVLVTGDGSLQLTVQEVGNMIRHNASAIVFIINNAGYTIERAIHGAHNSYNDTVAFDYSHMLQFFGMSASQAKLSFHKAETRSELDVVLRKECVRRPTGLQVIEIVMDKLDIPWSLAKQLTMRGPRFADEMRDSGFAVPGVSTR
ncbi:hypothetical protein AMS68_000999 [Peltaster fructicola]|uniref:Pyruvate decarboxylase n=1 Tax=Peltaster fructicola TaxID=286661 RepID=A0A6H0XL59_9PEZI|nr:hypothetical protein AMS68_000999 [Peltaster fructicola]